jgi:hypothetical protein
MLKRSTYRNRTYSYVGSREIDEFFAKQPYVCKSGFARNAVLTAVRAAGDLNE